MSTPVPAIPPAPPMTSLLSSLVVALSTVLSMLPAAQASQMAELAGTFLGNVGKPIIQAEVHDAFQALFGESAELGRPTPEFEHEFDGLRRD